MGKLLSRDGCVRAEWPHDVDVDDDEDADTDG